MPHLEKKFPRDAERKIFEHRYTVVKQDASFIYVKEKRTGKTLKVRKHICRGPWCNECGKTVVRKMTESEARMTGSAYTDPIGVGTSSLAVTMNPALRAHRCEIALADRMARILEGGYRSDVYWFRRQFNMDYVGSLGLKYSSIREQSRDYAEVLVGRENSLPSL